MTRTRKRGSVLVVASLLICSAVRGTFGEEPSPLCSVTDGVKQGTHHTATVSAILVSGRENSFLYDPQCENGKPMTWVDFQLKTKANKSRLHRVLRKSGRALVELDGEIWGPRLADPHSPETVRQLSPTGWGHLNGYRTRFVVRLIRKVETVPKEVPFFQWPKGVSGDASRPVQSKGR
jgi:hypothetical protein